MAHRRLTLLAGLAAAVLATSAAQAQTGADRRLDKVERDLKTLQSIVLQAQATGQPVVVKPEGPDPALAETQTRVADLEATLQRINGQVETLTHDLQEAHRADQAAEADRRTQMQALNERLARIEGQLTALTQATSAADPGLAAPPPAGPPPRGSSAGQDATARAQAEDQGVLGGRAGPPPAPAPPTPTEQYNAARALFTRGDAQGASDAFQDFVTRYPTNPRTPEAYYWLGESLYAQKSYPTAVAAYASALRNRPTTAWAPAAMVRLAEALAQSNQTTEACAAVAEFDQRYAARASAALKANAAAVRRRARCG